jgi:choline dehydrogenase-like flavoprotein
MSARVLSPLPVERIEFREAPEDTESHILGGTVMGRDPESSVVDPFLVHHRVRNLLVLGGGTFPTGSPSNPTLTISALALRASENLWG